MTNITIFIFWFCSFNVRNVLNAFFFAGEVKDLYDQLGEGGKSVVEFEKLKKKLEMEKEELQMSMEVVLHTIDFVGILTMVSFGFGCKAKLNIKLYIKLYMKFL